jgi:hypothetical protein
MASVEPGRPRVIKCACNVERAHHASDNLEQAKEGEVGAESNFPEVGEWDEQHGAEHEQGDERTDVYRCWWLRG